MDLNRSSQSIEVSFENIDVFQRGFYVLKEINATFLRGKITAIIGSSGSGKTSLIKTLLRFLPITKGTIYVDTVPIDRFSIPSFYAMFSVVSQDLRIFSDSLLSNITYGNQNASPKEVERILDVTHLLELIQRLPQGIHTMIGEGGTLLSKGEIQRVMIARCLLKPARMYVFDEPTSALDMQNEKSILTHVREYLHGKSIVIITHRLAILEHVDQIITMKDGQIESIHHA